MPPVGAGRPHLEHRAGVDGVDDLIGLEEGSQALVCLNGGEAVGLVSSARLVRLRLVVGDAGGDETRITQRRTIIGGEGSSRRVVRPLRLGDERLGTLHVEQCTARRPPRNQYVCGMCYGAGGQGSY
jgi:hypothetical protein